MEDGAGLAGGCAAIGAMGAAAGGIAAAWGTTAGAAAGTAGAAFSCSSDELLPASQGASWYQVLPCAVHFMTAQAPELLPAIANKINAPRHIVRPFRAQRQHLLAPKQLSAKNQPLPVAQEGAH
jgi:hypothetical protein